MYNKLWVLLSTYKLKSILFNELDTADTGHTEDNFLACLQISFPARNIVRGSAAAAGGKEKKRCRHATEEEEGPPQPAARSPQSWPTQSTWSWSTEDVSRKSGISPYW